MSRLDQLLKYLEAEPDDPFNIYAVAMEYMKSDPGKAYQFLSQLTQEHEDYIPAYYHLGKLEYAIGDPEKAKEIIRKGIVKSEQFRDQKTSRELKNALLEMEFD